VSAASPVSGIPDRGPLADPRPVIAFDGSGYRLVGGRCTQGHPLLSTFARCPRCRSEVETASFGPEGLIWATTRVHVPAFPHDVVPYVLAYVDLDDGPRVLLRLTNTPAGASVGDRVTLDTPTEGGNPTGKVTP
jgi:uncharacterized OB-fold protein